MSNSFNTEAVCFIKTYDRLGLEQKTGWTLPDAEVVRPLIQHAEFISTQRNNPGMDFAIPQLLVLDLADEFLRWCADPSQPRWARLFQARGVVRECEDYFGRHD